MNLKEAASVLGVHYQTAYKWVRTGELVAVRVGGRYEVSDAAIDRFRARRRAFHAAELPEETGTRPVTESEDVLEEFESMLGEPFVGLRSVTRFAVRRAAEIFGGACAIAIFDEDGNPKCLEVDHPNPGYATLIGSLVETFGTVTQTPGFAFSAFDEQKVLRISHVPQDLLRSQLRQELQQHLSLYPIRCLLSVPILVEGEPRGALTCTRSDADRPHSDEDEALCVQMAERVGRLIATAEDVEIAVNVRHRLTRGLSRMVEVPHQPVSETDLATLFDRVAARVDLPVAVMDENRVLLAVNSEFERFSGVVGNPIGQLFETVVHPVDRAADRASFDRLVTGELDFTDVTLLRQQSDGSGAMYTSHRAAVRAPDASLRYLVSVARLYRVPGDGSLADWPAFGEAIPFPSA
ncbi:MAG: excisionase family DNA-binding protein [Acidimicrobiia bacterium]|nr:excisionase family DNA-binding protein [Acidimicrobiia bacterium]